MTAGPDRLSGELGREPRIAAVAETLASRGAAGIAHPGGTLLAHLERVHALLTEWGARPAVRLAGLCHAYYGTDGFPVALGDPRRREELAAITGPEAERLVYLACDEDWYRILSHWTRSGRSPAVGGRLVVR